MSPSSLEEACVDVAWSHWSTLGVSAAMARSATTAIDLEALIAFTPAIADVDPRLRDESADWCIRNAWHLVSLSRLRQVLKLHEPPHHRRFGDFAAVVNAQSKSKWPTFDAASPTWAFVPSGKSRRRSMLQAALIQLRARKIFGINARAEILIALLFAAPGTTTARQLVQLGYTKRALADTLDDLARGGVLASPLRIGNEIRYSLHKRDAVAALLGPLPEAAPPWPERLAVAARLLALDKRTQGFSADVRSIELRKMLESVREMMASAGEPLPDLPPRQDLWPIVLDWIRPLLIP